MLVKLVIRRVESTGRVIGPENTVGVNVGVNVGDDVGINVGDDVGINVGAVVGAHVGADVEKETK